VNDCLRRPGCASGTAGPAVTLAPDPPSGDDEAVAPDDPLHHPVVEPDEAVDLDAPAGETMVQGRPARRWTTPVLVAVLVLVVAALLADRSLRESEVDSLVNDVEAASRTVALADQRITSMQLYLRPVAASGASTSGLAADLDGLVAQAAARGAQEVQGRQDALDEATVLPWHGDVREARVAVDTYLGTQVERLGAARVSDQPTEDAARDEAVAALRTAVPAGDQADRLEAALRGLPGGRASP